MTINENELINQMVNEILEALAQADASLLRLQKKSPAPFELRTLHQHFVSIKNTVSFYEFSHLNTLATAVEKLLATLSERKQPLTAVMVTQLFSAIDAIRDMLNDLREQGEETAFIYQSLLTELEKLHDMALTTPPTESQTKQHACLPIQEEETEFGEMIREIQSAGMGSDDNNTDDTASLLPHISEEEKVQPALAQTDIAKSKQGTLDDMQPSDQANIQTAVENDKGDNPLQALMTHYCDAQRNILDECFKQLEALHQHHLTELENLIANITTPDADTVKSHDES